MTARPEKVRQILDAMRDCESVEALAALRDEHRPYVTEIAKNSETKVFALHLANYAALRKRELEADEEKPGKS